MNNETQVQIQNKFCLTIDEAVIYFNIGEKKLRKLVSDNLDSGFIIQNGVKFLIKYFSHFIFMFIFSYS